MSLYLDEIRNVILLFSNPSWKGVGTVASTVVRNITALSGDVAYSARFSSNTTVLSSSYAAQGIISGLLYVPDLPDGHSCTVETASYIPHTVTRQSNLPPTNYHLIALAPWVNGRCSNAYLDAARTAPVRAFLFYQPGTRANAPPPAHSEQWHIQDSNAWMTRTAFPVFAVSAAVGEVMMQHSSLYSGNLTDVPYGDNIISQLTGDPEDYVRIWTELTIGTIPTGFATWAYVLIILGLLLAVVASTSGLMHLVQAWRRASLRRRVIAGDVNLEAMGIRRLTIPMVHIGTFPLFTYCYEPETGGLTRSPRPPRSPRSTRTSRHSISRAPTGANEANASRDTLHSRPSFSEPHPVPASSNSATSFQPACEICLELFVNRETIIRELPCGHIFHPECIDSFLSEASSLCPVCKASMLPPGYCPRITNDMVRRERAIRRLRGRVDDEEAGYITDDEETNNGRHEITGKNPGNDSRDAQPPLTWWIPQARSALFGGFRKHDSHQQPPPPPPPSPPPSAPLTESKETQPEAAGHQTRTLESGIQGEDGEGGEQRGALRRERMLELAGPEPAPSERGGTSRWKRIRMRVFPGF
ncbi:hypothetical protein VTJ83DRAFT_377 [Remersonia thermophila]|uniref:RING-type domain-containing protein n=1 Tax=Remersonia thermophila TaxID=72144 RepID=A0ABR4DKT8_9PEZI